MIKALEQWQIDDIRKQKAEGKTLMQLAQQYNVHYKTIENYLKPPKEEDPSDGQAIRIISNNPGKTRNYTGITSIIKGKEWVDLYRDEEMIATVRTAEIFSIEMA